MPPPTPAPPRSATVRIRLTDDLVRRFAGITGDVSSLHLDDAFARRSAYRKPVVHGMLPLAFLPLLAPFRREERQCLPTVVTGRFRAPVYAGNTVVLSLGPERQEDGEAAYDYQVAVNGSGTVAAEGTIRVRHRPCSRAGPPPSTITGSGAAAALLTSTPSPRSWLLEQIQVGVAEPPLEFRIEPGALGELLNLLRDGQVEPAEAALVSPAEAFDLPSLLSLLLFSTSVGVCLPGASATFVEFSAQVLSPLDTETDYRLEGRVTHRSKATTIVRKELKVQRADGTGDPLLEGRVAALVNPPARGMPTMDDLRSGALDLGLRDKVVLVTGASRGIGETIAKLFGLSGAHVIVNYLRGADDSERVVSELETAGAQALAIGADVANEEEVRDLVERAVDRFGRIDVLVNNAARDYRPIPFSRLTWEEVQKDLDVIAKGAFLCCQRVIPVMLEHGGGTIVNVSSSATELPPADQTKYVMAKSALVGLTRSLAMEYASRNIRVNMVVPHFVETDLVAHVPEGFRRKIADDVPMKRLASPVEVAQAVVFLASSYSSFTTGQKVMVTGGAPPLL